jgi:SHS2 domain-containing protein
VPATLERTLALTARSVDLLLYDWLAELIFLKDAEQAVFTHARVDVVPGPPSRLTAMLRGGRIDPERIALRADPKAVTFHRFALEPTPGGWRASVVIDI